MEDDRRRRAKTDKVDQLRTQLGNEIRVKAYQEGTRPFPDGAIIVALPWNRILSEDNNRVLAGINLSVSGPA